MKAAARPPKQKWLRYSLLSLLAVVTVCVVGFVWWGLTPLGPSDEALVALQSNDTVAVSKIDGIWYFTPKDSAAKTGYIFYSGGHVDARSYALYARDVAANGYLVAIPEMPLSLAVFGIHRATSVINSHPEIEHWGIGGHSLGGAMAASYAAGNSNKISGLILLAAYPASGSDLSNSGLSVASLYGTLDTVLNRASLEAGRKLLPTDTTYTELDGGNHAQFGSYGPQPGDTAKPAMSSDEQRNAATSATIRVLQGAP